MSYTLKNQYSADFKQKVSVPDLQRFFCKLIEKDENFFRKKWVRCMHDYFTEKNLKQLVH